MEEKGDYVGAERAYAAGLLTVSEPLNELAWLYFQWKQFTDALEMARIAGAIYPDDPRFRDTL